MMPITDRIKKVKWNLIGVFGNFLINGLFFSAKIEIEGWDRVQDIFDSKRLLIAFWHSRLLLPSYLHKRMHAVVLVSQSKDGEIISRILARQGQSTIRGSSTRGGLRALAGMIKYLKENGLPGAVTPDGPQGPRFKAKPGIITLAKKTGYPIVPMSYSASRIKVFSSWDRFILPYPFSRCLIIYGRPVRVPKTCDAREEERLRLELEAELCRITRRADHCFQHQIA
jgi:lysophospholipid acyltransferase (LPLAT)-like uncharacterized protein